jgi:hypothetical protein
MRLIGLQGEDYNFVNDGTVGLNGTAMKTLSIPVDALVGQYWVVKVTTTNLQNVVTVTSHTIYITN